MRGAATTYEQSERYAPRTGAPANRTARLAVAITYHFAASPSVRAHPARFLHCSASSNRSAAVEPEFLLRKHRGSSGFGVYADALFRWNRTTANDQYITVIGLFQQLKSWELDVGFRHLQSVAGRDIVLNSDNTIDYPRS